MKNLLLITAMLAASGHAAEPLEGGGGLYNISTRAFVGPGLQRAVAGFIIEGDSEVCVVIRGRGRDSVNLPKNKLLPDPKLHLKRVEDRALLRHNREWHKGPDVGVIVAAQLHLDLGPSDAAIFECLEPGAYTADLISQDGRSGIGIVEVFDILIQERLSNE